MCGSVPWKVCKGTVEFLQSKALLLSEHLCLWSQQSYSASRIPTIWCSILRNRLWCFILFLRFYVPFRKIVLPNKMVYFSITHYIEHSFHPPAQMLRSSGLVVSLTQCCCDYMQWASAVLLLPHSLLKGKIIYSFQGEKREMHEETWWPAQQGEYSRKASLTERQWVLRHAR